MIQLQIDPKSMQAVKFVIDEKVKQAEVIISPTSLTEIAKAMFTVTSKRFLRDLSVAAIEDPERFHHLYEWSAIGSPTNKLFLIKRSTVQYGKLSISFIPIKSTKPVPIDRRLLQPGSTGKVVSAQHIFRDKMKIMENGQPIHYEAKQTVAFSPDGNKIVFIPKGTAIDIINPGGVKTVNALRNFSAIWYSTTAPLALAESRLIRQIGNEVAKTMNSSRSSISQIQATIRRVTQAYSKEATIV